MTYRSIYKTNPLFPYSAKPHKLKKVQPSKHNPSEFHKENFDYTKKINTSNVLNKILAPIEKIVGRKINFDDIILVALIYLLYTEKDNENNILLFCLIFILLG